MMLSLAVIAARIIQQYLLQQVVEVRGTRVGRVKLFIISCSGGAQRRKANRMLLIANNRSSSRVDSRRSHGICSLSSTCCTPDSRYPTPVSIPLSIHFPVLSVSVSKPFFKRFLYSLIDYTATIKDRAMNMNAGNRQHETRQNSDCFPPKEAQSDATVSDFVCT